MDKLTIIRLLEGGRSQHSVARKLGIDRKMVSYYWKKHQSNQQMLANDLEIPLVI